MKKDEKSTKKPSKPVDKDVEKKCGDKPGETTGQKLDEKSKEQAKGSIANKKIKFPVQLPVAIALVVVLVVAVDLGLYLFKWGDMQQDWWQMHEYQAQARDTKEVLGAQSTDPLAASQGDSQVVTSWQCIDSDENMGEADKYEAGFAVFYDEKGNPVVYNDECSDSGAVVYESACFSVPWDEETTSVMSVERLCENGCADGACLR